MASPLDEVLESFQALMDARAEASDEQNRGNFRCERCEGCALCRFCTDCLDCEDCTYCDGCSDCTGCTHCKDCDGCTQLTHSTWSSACKDGSYLTLCLECTGCVQCFACVGLRNEEFCILNEKLPRKVYFRRVAELRAAFQQQVDEGWRPPWLLDEDDEDIEDDEVAVDADVDDRAQDRGDESLAAEAPEAPEAPETRSQATDDAEPDTATNVPSPEPADSSTSLHLEALWATELAEPSPVLVEGDSGPIVFEPPRTEPTVDTGEPEDSARHRQQTPPWSFDHVRRGRGGRAQGRGDPAIPEPPPFGAADDDAPAIPRRRDEEERTRPREPADLARDRYGWSAQTEGTPESPGWTASALGPQRDRPSWERSADPPSRPRRWGGDAPGSRPSWDDDIRAAPSRRRRGDDTGATAPPANRPSWSDAHASPSPARSRWDDDTGAAAPPARPGWGDDTGAAAPP
ncbi:MAG: hypothetical protein KDK70_20305, partial [Myxococcales bacterium]|nr:hypothetical protein [Myxococcales bacterium]